MENAVLNVASAGTVDREFVYIESLPKLFRKSFIHPLPKLSQVRPPTHQSHPELAQTSTPESLDYCSFLEMGSQKCRRFAFFSSGLLILLKRIVFSNRFDQIVGTRGSDGCYKDCGAFPCKLVFFIYEIRVSSS